MAYGIIDMNAKKFDEELLKRLKEQRKALEDTAFNMPLPSPVKKKSGKIRKTVKKNEPTKKRK